MRAAGVPSASWGERLGAQALRAAGIAALAVAFGCADRPTPAEAEGAVPAPLPAQAASPASTPPAIVVAASPRPRLPLPPPVAMPGGGVRIDMRGTGRHVRALERQADGTYKHICVDAPELAPAGGSR